MRRSSGGIGARVKIVAGGRPQSSVVLSQSGYFSHDDSRVHFGIGRSEKLDLLEITWPSGLIETFRDVPVNQTFTATEGRVQP